MQKEPAAMTSMRDRGVIHLGLDVHKNTISVGILEPVCACYEAAGYELAPTDQRDARRLARLQNLISGGGLVPVLLLDSSAGLHEQVWAHLAPRRRTGWPVRQINVEGPPFRISLASRCPGLLLGLARSPTWTRTTRWPGCMGIPGRAHRVRVPPGQRR